MEDFETMRKQILIHLSDIEKRENVKILYAAESGSRAWDFASPDSDFDIRFIYVRPLTEYLRLDCPRDVIEYVLNDELDINGWDISKALKLLHASNPTLFEWLNSPLVYRSGGEAEEIKALAGACFSSEAGVRHYLHMAERNYREYLKGDLVKLKKYFYVIRPILAARHILKEGTPPPMRFSELADKYLEDELLEIVGALLKQKTEAAEIKRIPRIDRLNEWIEMQFVRLAEAASELPRRERMSWERLNGIFYRCLGVAER